MKPKYFKNLLLITCTILFVQCAAVKSAKIADQNKETVKLWFEEGWNNNRHEDLLSVCFTEDWEDGNPLQADQMTGLEGMLKAIQNYKKMLGNSHFNITHLFAEDNFVTIRYELTSTHKGNILGLESTNKTFSTTGMAIYEMENGKIKKSWHEVDMTGIINQLKD